MLKISFTGVGFEFRFMYQLDQSPNVTKWASEEFYIPYMISGENFTRRYFVDLYYETANGKKYLVEVKPSEQTKPPKQKKNSRRYLKEMATYAQNEAKWKAASAFAKHKGWQFVIWTEKDLPDEGKTLYKKRR